MLLDERENRNIGEDTRKKTNTRQIPETLKTILCQKKNNDSRNP